jgi:hypothetical protein
LYWAWSFLAGISSFWCSASHLSEAEGEGEVAALPRNFWTPEEGKRLRMLVEACKPIEIVAAELKRSVPAYIHATLPVVPFALPEMVTALVRIARKAVG